MLTLEAIEATFEPSPGGTFMQRFGAAGEHAPFSQKKLCLVATDRELLMRTVYDVSLRADCHWVKYSREPRAGMLLGRCFMTSDDAAGRLWLQLRTHPQLMVALQDDDFVARFR
ncbi:MAG TPA: hypothetical protein VMG12_14810 [Polyangiaceae bacterium]|nr:hypothetical protein [Polyangiaceae bacterium]